MADDDDLTEIPITIPPPNPRVKPPRRQIVWVDPDDPDSLFWWPAMVVPKDEFQIFKKSVNGEVEDPKDGECVVVYFEDASYNTVKESDYKTFCPFQPPYTSEVHGKNGRAFCRDPAVMRATVYWETGKVPPAFTWLRSFPPEDRSKAGRLHGETIPASIKNDDAAGAGAAPPTSGKKQGGSGMPTALSRRGSMVNNPKKESGAGKEASTKNSEKSLSARKSQGQPPGASKAGAAPKSPMPIVNLNMTGPTPTAGSKSKGGSKAAANAQSQSTSKTSHKRGGRDEGSGANATAAAQHNSCQKCGRRDAKTRRLSAGAGTASATAPSAALTVAVAQQEGIVGIHLCQPCRGVLDELMPPSQSAEEEEEPPWKPERRHLRILRNVLPERNADLLVRHFRALQEVGQREREQAHLRAGGGGGGSSGNPAAGVFVGALTNTIAVAPPIFNSAAAAPAPSSSVAAGYGVYAPQAVSSAAPIV
ncbi:hypothetical protein HDU86_002609 [Geranomyces michiganensis]|nr:hypothetical protein HDU86_002609 [Geranomyces michiganensis]